MIGRCSFGPSTSADGRFNTPEQTREQCGALTLRERNAVN
jgi:hypothetical protein